MSAIREWLAERAVDSRRPVACGIGCSESGSATLTARERDVLNLIGRGKSTKKIAESLCLADATIAEYRKRICRKLDLHSTGELAACAVAQLTGTCRKRAADEACPL
jgi:DNA-binding NarL/FixJ family response regulator